MNGQAFANNSSSTKHSFSPCPHCLDDGPVCQHLVYLLVVTTFHPYSCTFNMDMFFIFSRYPLDIPAIPIRDLLHAHKSPQPRRHQEPLSIHRRLLAAQLEIFLCVDQIRPLSRPCYRAVTLCRASSHFMDPRTSLPAA